MHACVQKNVQNYVNFGSTYYKVLHKISVKFSHGQLVLSIYNIRERVMPFDTAGDPAPDQIKTTKYCYDHHKHTDLYSTFTASGQLAISFPW